MKFITQIYYPNKDRVNISKAQKYYFGGLILASIFILLAWINQDNWNNDSLKTIFNVCIFISIGIFVYGMFISINSAEKPNGILTGFIAISADLIEIDESKFKIQDVQNLKIIINDYKGKLKSSGLSFGPWKSAGTNNSLKFKYQNHLIEKQFRINSEKEFELLKKLKIELNTVANTV